MQTLTESLRNYPLGFGGEIVNGLFIVLVVYGLPLLGCLAIGLGVLWLVVWTVGSALRSGRPRLPQPLVERGPGGSRPSGNPEDPPDLKPRFEHTLRERGHRSRLLQ